jgi:hypothetical protein
MLFLFAPRGIEMKRIEPDKDNHVVWGTENFMGKSMANDPIHELNPMHCSVCERSFIYLQDDYPPSLNISRCMECYGQRFGLEHLQTYLRELGDHPVLKIPLQFFWETPTSNPKVKEELEKRGYTYNDK